MGVEKGAAFKFSLWKPRGGFSRQFGKITIFLIWWKFLSA